MEQLPDLDRYPVDELLCARGAAHRVTPVEADRARMIAVFSYYEYPGASFSEEERLGFYGRAQAG